MQISTIVVVRDKIANIVATCEDLYNGKRIFLKEVLNSMLFYDFIDKSLESDYLKKIRSLTENNDVFDDIVNDFYNHGGISRLGAYNSITYEIGGEDGYDIVQFFFRYNLLD